MRLPAIGFVAFGLLAGVAAFAADTYQPAKYDLSALPAYARLGRYIAAGAALDAHVELLVRQLAAELSGCRWCIEHGLHRWRKAFLPAAELAAQRHYGASPVFSARDRAALAFTEAVSRYAEATGGIPEAVLAELRRHFSEPEVAALTLAVAGEHFFNPATGALLGHAARSFGGSARDGTPGFVPPTTYAAEATAQARLPGHHRLRLLRPFYPLALQMCKPGYGSNVLQPCDPQGCPDQRSRRMNGGSVRTATASVRRARTAVKGPIWVSPGASTRGSGEHER